MSLNVDLLRSTFDQARPLGVQITDKFYEFLFINYPEAKGLFDEAKMDQQKLQLLNAIAFVVDHLDDSEKLVKFLSDLGKRHVGYGVKDVHYDWVGDSLLKTLEFFFKEAWTDEVRTAWTEAYGVIAQTMRQGTS